MSSIFLRTSLGLPTAYYTVAALDVIIARKEGFTAYSGGSWY